MKEITRSENKERGCLLKTNIWIFLLTWASPSPQALPRPACFWTNAILLLLLLIGCGLGARLIVAENFFSQIVEVLQSPVGGGSSLRKWHSRQKGTGNNGSLTLWRRLSGGGLQAPPAVPQEPPGPAAPVPWRGLSASSRTSSSGSHSAAGEGSRLHRPQPGARRGPPTSRLVSFLVSFWAFPPF